MTLQEIIIDLKKTEEKAQNSIDTAQKAASTAQQDALANARTQRQAQDITLDKERNAKLSAQEKKVAKQAEAIRQEVQKSLKDLETKASKKKAQIIKAISEILQ